MSASLDPAPRRRPTADGPPPNGWAAPTTLPIFDEDRMPAVILIASIVTGLASTLTFMLITLAGFVFGRAATAVVEAFGIAHSNAWVWGTLAGFAATCAASGVCAILITRRSQVARWALVALSALTIAVSAMLAFTILISIANVIAASTVLVLLLVPEAGQWFQRPMA